jgi:TPP-dependent pyruvate/acetoin dehydrogenase alpha subunit
LLETSAAGDADLEAMKAEVESEIAAGVEFAIEAPFPDAGEVTQHVYA